MDKKEFQERMRAARVAEAAQIVPNNRSSSSRDPWPTMNYDKETHMCGRHYPFMEAEAGELAMEDVRKLLGVYKDVITRYSLLCKVVRGLNIDKDKLPNVLREDLGDSISDQLEATKLVASDPTEQDTGG